MNDLRPWMQSDWLALGSLLIRLGFLLAAVWFAHSFLQTIRIFQEQLGALLKLSISPSASEEQTVAARSIQLEQASPYWLPQIEPRTAANTFHEPAETGPNRLVLVWRGLIHWLNEPVSHSRHHVSYWRRMINWLQAPAGS